MYVYIYKEVYTLYVCMCAHVLHISVHANISDTYVYACRHVYAHTYVHTCTMYEHIHICVCIYMFIYITCVYRYIVDFWGKAHISIVYTVGNACRGRLSQPPNPTPASQSDPGPVA